MEVQEEPLVLLLLLEEGPLSWEEMEETAILVEELVELLSMLATPLLLEQMVQIMEEEEEEESTMVTLLPMGEMEPMASLSLRSMSTSKSGNREISLRGKILKLRFHRKPSSFVKYTIAQ